MGGGRGVRGGDTLFLFFVLLKKRKGTRERNVPLQRTERNVPFLLKNVTFLLEISPCIGQLPEVSPPLTLFLQLQPAPPPPPHSHCIHTTLCKHVLELLEHIYRGRAG